MSMFVAPRPLYGAPTRMTSVMAAAEYETLHVDVASFDALYAREARPMLRLAYLMVGSHAVAEEVVQDAFAKVYEKWHRIDAPGAYLRTCVVNSSRRSMRRARMEGDRMRLDGDATVHETEYLHDALARLSPKQRAAIVLRYFDDRSEADIAAMLNVRPGTVKSLLSRGLDELREVLPR
jgi:RNA polymerase sigma-70 factor (sigma-E family)